MASATYKKELKKQLRFAFTAAVGFTIAFAWRDVIFNAAQNFINRYIQTTLQTLSNLYTAIFLTIIGTLIIFLTSKLLKDR